MYVNVTLWLMRILEVSKLSNWLMIDLKSDCVEIYTERFDE